MFRTTSRQKRRFQPQVESLEDRCVPAVILASTAVLVGMLRPIEFAKVGPQPEPPTRPVYDGILIGMLRPAPLVQDAYAKIITQPTLLKASENLPQLSPTAVTEYFSQLEVTSAPTNA